MNFALYSDNAFSDNSGLGYINYCFRDIGENDNFYTIFENFGRL